MKTNFIPIAMTALWTCSAGALGAPDLIIADFEGPNYGSWRIHGQPSPNLEWIDNTWKTTGDAFGSGPARGTLPNQMPVEGYLGKGLVNSFLHGDASTGTLTSPPFQIQRRYIQFLIGGGYAPGKTCINLIIDGRIVRTASGPNDRPGGSERLDWLAWDVSDLANRQAVIEIVDQATGGWGHINIDHILQTDRQLAGWTTNARRQILINRDYLNLPIKNGAPKVLMSVHVDNNLERQFEIELAERDPDWWAFLDAKSWRGKTVVVQADKLRDDSQGLQLIEPRDSIKDGENLYREKLRPQFHFTSRRGWNNDPNGLVYFQGEYHLFYQHNPYGWNWGNMHWGHAVSRDLVHWSELGEALYPDDLGAMFSGSAVVDWHNTTGFSPGTQPPLVLIYTAAGATSAQSRNRPFTQCLAFSLDQGRTWTKYDRNPVLPHIIGGNRDPKVLWHEPLKKWIMALYLDKNEFGLFASPNLKQWDRLSSVQIPGSSECPEFFEIAVDDNPAEKRWVFYGGNGFYLVGRFDGAQFTVTSGPHPLHAGNCFYASQTYSDIPKDDGRRVLIGWGQVNLPGMPFNQMMDFPVSLSLRSTPAGLRLFAWPVHEIEKLRRKTHTASAQEIGELLDPFPKVRLDLADIETEIAVRAAAQIDFAFRGLVVSYDVQRHQLSCLGKHASLPPQDGKIQLRFLLDRASLEIFGNQGQLYMPMGNLFRDNERSLKITAQGHPAQLRSLSIHELQSAW